MSKTFKDLRQKPTYSSTKYNPDNHYKSSHNTHSSSRNNISSTRDVDVGSKEDEDDTEESFRSRSGSGGNTTADNLEDYDIETISSDEDEIDNREETDTDISIMEEDLEPEYPILRENKSLNLAERQLSYVFLPESSTSHTNLRVPTSSQKVSASSSPALSYESVILELESEFELEDRTPSRRSSNNFDEFGPTEEIEDESSPLDENDSDLDDDYMDLKVKVEKRPFSVLSDSFRVTVRLQPPSEIEEDANDFYEEPGNYSDRGLDTTTSESVSEESVSEGESETSITESRTGDSSEEKSDDDETAATRIEKILEEGKFQKKPNKMSIKGKSQTSDNQEGGQKVIGKVASQNNSASVSKDKESNAAPEEDKLEIAESKSEEVTDQKEETEEKAMYRDLFGTIDANNKAEADVESRISEKVNEFKTIGAGVGKTLGSIKTLQSDRKGMVSDGLNKSFDNLRKSAEKGVSDAVTGTEIKPPASVLDMGTLSKIKAMHPRTKSSNSLVAQSPKMLAKSSEIDKSLPVGISTKGKDLKATGVEMGTLAGTLNKLKPTQSRNNSSDSLLLHTNMQKDPAALPLDKPLIPSDKPGISSPINKPVERLKSSNEVQNPEKGQMSLPPMTGPSTSIATTKVVEAIVHQVDEGPTESKVDAKPLDKEPESSPVHLPESNLDDVLNAITPEKISSQDISSEEEGDVDENYYLSVYAETAEELSADDYDEGNTIAKQKLKSTQEEVQDAEKEKDRLVEIWKLQIKETNEELDENFSTILDDMVRELKQGPVIVQEKLPENLLGDLASVNGVASDPQVDDDDDDDKVDEEPGKDSISGEESEEEENIQEETNPEDNMVNDSKEVIELDESIDPTGLAVSNEEVEDDQAVVQEDTKTKDILKESTAKSQVSPKATTSTSATLQTFGEQPPSAIFNTFGEMPVQNVSPAKSTEETYDMSVWGNIYGPSAGVQEEETVGADTPSKRFRKWNNSTEIASTLSEYLQRIKTETIAHNVTDVLPLLTELISVSRKVQTEIDLATLIASMSAVRVLCDRFIDVKTTIGEEKGLKNVDLSWLIKILCKISVDADCKVRPEASFTLARLVRASGPELIVRPIYFLLVMEASGHKGQGAKMKAAALDVLTYTLISFPREDFDDLEEISRWVCLLVQHKQRRVRQSSLECIAVLADRLGDPEYSISAFRRFIVIESEQNYSRSGSDVGGGVDQTNGAAAAVATIGPAAALGSHDISAISAMSARIRKRKLPIPSPHGLIEYGVKVPTGKKLVEILTKLQEEDDKLYDFSSADENSFGSNIEPDAQEIQSEVESIRMSDLERTAKEIEDNGGLPLKKEEEVVAKEDEDKITIDIAYILGGKGRVVKQDYDDDEEDKAKAGGGKAEGGKVITAEALFETIKTSYSKSKKKRKRRKKKRERKKQKEDETDEGDSLSDDEGIF